MNHDLIARLEFAIQSQSALDVDDELPLFLLILRAFLQYDQEHIYHFAANNIEHFLDGYITNQSQGLAQLSLKAELDQIYQQCDTLAPGHRLFICYFVCRFLLLKSAYELAQHYALVFLQNYTDESHLYDPIMFSFMRYASQELAIDASQDTLLSAKKLQAEVYIKKSILDARAKLTPHFLDDPLEPLFSEYPNAIRPIIAKMAWEYQKTIPS